ncbi:MAG: L-rhamnose isomerase [Spirochaetales bacterium]|nr:L-rhamnose isomerase [Spirochaetales bacterium]
MNQYQIAKDCYAAMDINTDDALTALKKISLSLHCWQADDVGGFEQPISGLDGGGIQVTGNHPGKARTMEELRLDLEKAYSLIPGNHRLNLHAIYGDFASQKVDRNTIGPQHFLSWMDWAAEQKIPLDFNGTFFSHPYANDGFTLSHPKKSIREFWIEHGRCCRRIAAEMGKRQNSPCQLNTWIPDGSKEVPINRLIPRERLKNSLDSMMEESYSQQWMRDALETKLFGIGSESYVVGSHEFYMGYAARHDVKLCLDMGHFHPTESIADKLSSLYLFFQEILLHVSRPVRWDSDHVVILNDELLDLTREIVRCGHLQSTHIGLDFFDATMNRVGAYAIGARSVLKALLAAFLEPKSQLKEWDAENNAFARMALQEQCKLLPLGMVWDQFCLESNVPTDKQLIGEVMDYETLVQSRRQA